MGETRNDTVRVFNGREIRVAWSEEGRKELYSVVDVCGILSGSVQPRKYWSDLKTKLKAEDGELSEKIGQLKRFAPDGKMRLTDVADADTILELIKYIKSKETDAFGSWLFGTKGGRADTVVIPEVAGSSIVRAENVQCLAATAVRDNEPDFKEIVSMIVNTSDDVFRYANRKLITMYWRVGEHVSKKVTAGEWGKAVVEDLAAYIQKKCPGVRGFSPQNIWRMKQFYETYCDNKFLSPLVREIGWTNNVLIMTAAKTDEAREFYLRLSAKNDYSKRDLERQINSGMFERRAISNERNRPLMEKNPGMKGLHDNYVFEFLSLADEFDEKELRKEIMANMHDFLLEFGREFRFVDEEYRVRVGKRTFHVDLLFYNADLSCYVAIELKTTDFKPAYMGQMKLYLNAIDRDIRRPNENPSVGVVLCTGRGDAVAEYMLNENMTPAMVAEYRTRLPDKALLERRLREIKERAELGWREDG